MLSPTQAKNMIEAMRALKQAMALCDSPAEEWIALGLKHGYLKESLDQAGDYPKRRYLILTREGHNVLRNKE